MKIIWERIIKSKLLHSYNVSTLNKGLTILKYHLKISKKLDVIGRKEEEQVKSKKLVLIQFKQ